MTADNIKKKIEDLNKYPGELIQTIDILKKEIDNLESSIEKLELEKNKYVGLSDDKYFKKKLQQKREDLIASKNELKERKAQHVKQYPAIRRTISLSDSLNDFSKKLPDSLESVTRLQTLDDFYKLQYLINEKLIDRIKNMGAELLATKEAYSVNFYYSFAPAFLSFFTTTSRFFF